MQDDAKNINSLEFKMSCGKDPEVRKKLDDLGLKFGNGLSCLHASLNEDCLIIQYGIVAFYPIHEWRAYDADKAEELSKEKIMKLMV